MSKVSRAPSVPSSPELQQPRAPHQLSIAFESTVTLDLSDSERTGVTAQLATLLMQAAGLAAGVMMANTEQLPDTVLRRKAVVYVRQSTQSQVQNNLESKRRQYGLVEEARRRGFAQIEVIDDDLGKSASGTVARPGFDRLVAWLCAGEVGAVLCCASTPHAWRATAATGTTCWNNAGLLRPASSTSKAFTIPAAPMTDCSWG